MHNDEEVLENGRLGQNIRALRERRGLSLLELCDALGSECRCERLESYELGRANVPSRELVGIAGALGTTVAELTEGVELSQGDP